MIKVTLLGDSIREIGYGLMVPALLGKDFEVFQPDDNCRFAKYTLRGLFEWEADMAGSRIVHWNNGHWDVCDTFGDGCFSSISEYTENMLRIADILLSRYDKVIFATTPPVREGHPYNSNANIEKYNAAIVPLLEEKGVIINDMHKLVSSDVNKYILDDDKIHLTVEGMRVCAEQTVDIIKKVALMLD